MQYEDFLSLAQARRSTRRYLSDPVSDEMVDKVIEAGRWAPSGFNIQPWEFFVLRDKKTKDEIVRLVKEYRQTHFSAMEPTREAWQGRPWAPYHPEGMDWSNAPVFIVLFGDRRLIDGLPMTVRYLPHKRESIFTATLAAAYVYMGLAATSLGLGSQWVTAVQTPLVHCRIKEMLKAPKEFEIFDMLVLGHPAIKPNKKLMRSKDKMVHYEPFSEEDFRSDEEVRDYIRRARSWVRGTSSREPNK